MKRLLYSLCCLLAVVLLGSCRSTKKVTADMSSYTDYPALMNDMNANRCTDASVTAKISLKVKTGDETESIGGTLRMKRDDVIQLQLVYMGLKEVARIEMTRDTLMVIDRMNHRYMKLLYTQVPYFQRAGINFYTFQSLFWDEIFLPDSKGETVDLSRFQTSPTPDGPLFYHNNQHVALRFIGNVAKGVVGQTHISGSTMQMVDLTWKYNEWKKLNGKPFPSKMDVSLLILGTKSEMSIELSKIKSDRSWKTRADEPGKKYQLMNGNDVIKLLTKMITP